jgi:hypothetical protein
MFRTTCWACLLAVLLAGCQRMTMTDWSMFGLPTNADADDVEALDEFDEEDDEKGLMDEFTTKADTPFVGEYSTVAGLNLITLEGVGLVTGLDGTGGNPPPSKYRTRLLDQMRKEGITNPNEWLARPDTALVVVRADFPPLVKPGDKFDVKVRLPQGSTATSLQGGWLLPTYLSEAAVVAGKGVLKGHEFAKAAGPILVSTGQGDSADLAGVLRRGRVLGGGTSLKSRDMALYLNNDYRSVRNATRIAGKIGLRFHEHDQYGIRKPLAEAKTDRKVELKIPDRYRDNFQRYLSVVARVPFRETEVARRIRLEKLEDRLNTPESSADAAVELEAIGVDGIPILRAGLNNPAAEVRFHSATALAYLEDPSGLSHLTEAARNEPAFRVYALAALAAADEGESMLLLRSLLDSDSAELRYGAFRAMTVIDEHDPYVSGEPLPDAEHPQFRLHVLDTTGPPMVHITHYQKAEIVVLGREQMFETPFVAKAGKYILVKAEPGNDHVVVARHDPNFSDRKEVPNRVADVIRAVAQLGASYPEVAAMLVQADQQGNLPGRFEIDALPRPGRKYLRPAEEFDGEAPRETYIGRETATPNLFELRDEDDE